MKVNCALYLFGFLLSNLHLIASQISQQAFFLVVPHSVYIPQSTASLLMNLTSNSIYDLVICAQKCLNNKQCLTATYYQQTRTCSLYNEGSRLGTISNVGDPGISVLIMESRRPVSRICFLTGQRSWAENAMTVAGDSSGNAGLNLSQLYEPIAIYYDRPYRSLIVGDNGNASVLQFSLDNVSADGIVIAGGNDVGCGLDQFTFIVGVAMDSLRQLYVADSACFHILQFPPDSNSTTSGTVINTTYTPQGIFIDPLTDDLYVALHDFDSVVKFSRNSTTFVVVAGGNGAGSGLNQVQSPNNVYFDYLNTNSLYVVDSGNNRILKFPMNSNNATYGTVVAGGNSRGNDSNQLDDPRAVIVDRGGILYISDKNNSRIQRWLPNANDSDTIAGGTQGSAANQLDSPESIFFDEYFNLFVADRSNNRVQSFKLNPC